MSKRTFGLIVIVCGLSLSVFAHAQTGAQLSPWMYQQFSNVNGVLAGGCVFVYSGGTTTPINSYTDSTASTPNTNPVILDSSGVGSIWFLSGVAYKIAIWSAGGVNCASGTLQKTIDNITIPSSAGSAATSLTSAGANPATSGVIRLAKGEGVCWRNNGNSGNLCMSPATSAPVDQLTWPQGILLTEIAAPNGLAGSDLLWADSTVHRLKQSGNGASAAQLVNAGVDINTSDQVTVTHLASALPVAQGGTGQTTLTSLPLVTPTIGGTTITNVPLMTWGGMLATVAADSANTNPFSGWTASNAVQIKAFYIYSQQGASCAAYPTYTIQDNGSNINSITLTNAFSWSNTGLSINVAAGHTLTLAQTANGTTCTAGTKQASANFVVSYQMQ